MDIKGYDYVDRKRVFCGHYMTFYGLARYHHPSAMYLHVVLVQYVSSKFFVFWWYQGNYGPLG